MVASILVLLCLGFAGKAVAQTRVPGVSTGDYFVYSITSHWSSDNASEPIPDSLLQLNQTTQYKVFIGGVADGINVTATHIWDFNNGTEVPYLITIDIESGTPYYLSGTAPPFEGIVGANLSAGDLLHPSGNDYITINRTITRNYAGGVRPTNVVDLSSPIQNQTTDNNQTALVTIGSQDVTYYIDQATGVLVEENSTVQSFTPQESASIIWILKETNVWDASPPMGLLLPSIIATVVAVVVVVVAVAIYQTRRKSRRKKR
jgi:hypothetical protein